jgi:hypothetical protein
LSYGGRKLPTVGSFYVSIFANVLILLVGKKIKPPTSAVFADKKSPARRRSVRSYVS